LSSSKPPTELRRRRGGNPPEAHRFKPGQSGNPGGRPKKRPDLREAFRELLGENAAEVMNRDPKDFTFFELLALTCARKSKPRDMVALLGWLEGAHPPPRLVEADDQDIDDPDDAAIVEAALQRRLRQIPPTPVADPEEA